MKLDAISEREDDDFDLVTAQNSVKGKKNMGMKTSIRSKNSNAFKKKQEDQNEFMKKIFEGVESD